MYLIPVCGLLGLAFAWLRSSWINKQDAGDDRMQTIAGHIRAGAMAFLGREYHRRPGANRRGDGPRAPGRPPPAGPDRVTARHAPGCLHVLGTISGRVEPVGQGP
jgi:hypothetical protein